VISAHLANYHLNFMDIYSVLCIILASIFLLTFIGLMLQIAYMVRYESQNTGFNVTKLFLALVPWTLLLRSIDYFNNKQLLAPFDQQTYGEIIFGSLPGYILFTTYTMLIICWIALIHKANNNNENFVKGLWTIFGFVNVIIFVCVITFYILLVPEDSTTRLTIHKVEAIFATSLSIIVMLLFVTYGLVLYKKLSDKYGDSSEARRRMANKVGKTSLICTLIFLIRAIAVLGSMAPINNAGRVAIGIIYPIVCEWLPTILMFNVLKPQRRKNIWLQPAESINESSTNEPNTTSPLIKDGKPSV